MTQIIATIIHDLDDPALEAEVKTLVEDLISKLPAGKLILATFAGQSGQEDISPKEPTPPSDAVSTDDGSTTAADGASATAPDRLQRLENLVERVVNALGEDLKAKL